MVQPGLKFQPFTALPFVGGIHVTVLGIDRLLRTEECLFVRVMKLNTLGQHNFDRMKKLCAPASPPDLLVELDGQEELVCKTLEGLRGLGNASALAKWRVVNGWNFDYE